MKRRQTQRPRRTSERSRGGLLLLALGALGVVFGDIGTSPLYALREALAGGFGVTLSPANILGVLSLIFWSLVLVISVKYLLFVMRADNDGEGGILALTYLATRDLAASSRGRGLLLVLGLFGTALLYGDGMITPAISVLSAVEGLAVVSPGLEQLVLPLTVAILVALFAVQRRGSGTIGAWFGPIMVIWFVTLALLGLLQVARAPDVLAAVNPLHAWSFFARNAGAGFLVLGAVFLVVTGGEALYADMGHFGKGPIRLAWFALVLPALLLNYFGQGALLLADPTAIDNPFFRLAPEWGRSALLLLATVATIIASQALISGAFSLSMQAVQLGYSPRLEIDHTSAQQFGQVYVPFVNACLMLGCVALVLGFGSSAALATAYGVAVTLTMIITSVLLAVVMVRRWRWPSLLAAFLGGGFIVIDLAFVSANLFKVPQGGWFPLLVGGVVFTLMSTWKQGRELVAERLGIGAVPVRAFLHSLDESKVIRVPGTAVYMHSRPGSVPPALLANLRHYHALHEQVLLLAVRTELQPRVPPAGRVSLEALEHGFFQLILHFGFMEETNVPPALYNLVDERLYVEPSDTTFFLGREALLVTDKPGMAPWQEHLFAFMARNALDAARFFALPPEHVIEVGIPVEL